METRIRMAITLAGLPAPDVQHPVLNGRYRLDLAYPDRMPAIEYDGELHRTRARGRQDLDREAALTRLGRTVLRFDAATVLGNPAAIVGSVRSGW